MSIILDERAYVEEIIRSPELGKKPTETLNRLAKYYRSNGYKSREIVSLLESFMIKCDPGVNLVKWQSLLDKVVRSSSKYDLIFLEGVSITESEMNKIKALNGKQLQKLMFCLLCVAKYCNAVNPKNNNWVNKADKEIFSMAGIRTTIKRQSYMINDLWDAGYVGFSNVVDNININVKIVDDDSKEVLFVSDFRNLGNQYLRYLGEPYIECECCGAVVRKNSNVQKYCPDCAEAVNLRKTEERYYRLKH